MVPSENQKEDTKSVFEQTYAEIKNEEEFDETNNLTADDVEEVWVSDVSIRTKSDQLATLKNSAVLENTLKFGIVQCMWIRTTGYTTIKKRRFVYIKVLWT